MVSSFNHTLRGHGYVKICMKGEPNSEEWETQHTIVES